MQRQNTILLQQINNKKNTSGMRRVHTTSQILTSKELVDEWMEDKAKREAKAQKEADERAKKAECEKQQQTTRALGTKQFGGVLSSKSKTELEDIAAALALTEDGNKHVLIH